MSVTQADGHWDDGEDGHDQRHEAHHEAPRPQVDTAAGSLEAGHCKALSSLGRIDYILVNIEATQCKNGALSLVERLPCYFQSFIMPEIAELPISLHNLLQYFSHIACFYITLQSY